MIPTDWIEHRRTDRETLGWIVPVGEKFHSHNLLGWQVTTEPVDWLEAEETLDALGIGYLADRYLLTLTDGTSRPVRIAEASGHGVTVIADEFGAASAVGANSDTFRLPFPAPKELAHQPK